MKGRRGMMNKREREICDKRKNEGEERDFE